MTRISITWQSLKKSEWINPESAFYRKLQRNNDKKSSRPKITRLLGPISWRLYQYPWGRDNRNPGYGDTPVNHVLQRERVNYCTEVLCRSKVCFDSILSYARRREVTLWTWHLRRLLTHNFGVICWAFTTKNSLVFVTSAAMTEGKYVYPVFPPCVELRGSFTMRIRINC